MDKKLQTQEKGGLGIKDLKKMNISLLTKWWWKLDIEDGLWQDIVKFKYLKKDSICTVKHRQNDSAIWSDLLKVRDIYLQGRKMIGRDGKKTLFWKDTWLFDKPLNYLFPDLFKLCLQPDISVFQVKQNSVSFRRWLVDDLKSGWDKIMSEVDGTILTPGKDVAPGSLVRMVVFL